MEFTQSKRSRRSIVAASALFSLTATAVLLPGCGGSSGTFTQEAGTSIPTPGRGAMRFIIQWPDGSSDSTRQVPAAANSVVITLTENNNQVAPPKVVSRPPEGNSVVTFPDMPVTNVSATVIAYASSDGTGEAQSNGTTTVQVQEGQTTGTSITLEGTIAQVIVTASAPSAAAGQSVKLTASALDTDGKIVLTSEEAWAWAAPDSAVADFSSSGSTATLVAKAAGSAVVSAKETKSGAVGQATVQVTSSSGNAVGLANTPWPKFRGNARNTGQGVGSGATGNLLWKYPTESSIDTSPAIGKDGVIYIASGDNYLYALNTDGTLRWKYQTGSNSLSSPAIDANGTIYIGTGISDQHIYAINADGTLRWKTLIGSSSFSSPAIGADGTVYVGSQGTYDMRKSSYSQYLFAINTDGSVQWTFQNGGNPFYSPTIGPDGTIYVGDFGGFLYAINTDSTLRWKFRVNFPIGTSPTLGNDGTLYVASESGYLYAVNSDGTQRWMTKLESGIGGSPAISDDGAIYITGGGGGFTGGSGYVAGRDGGFLYAFNSDGTLRWKYQTEKRFGTSPAIGADGTIYVGNDDSNIYAFNTDGTVRWKYQAGREIKSSPAIGADGTLYFGSIDQSLYAIH